MSTAVRDQGLFLEWVLDYNKTYNSYVDSEYSYVVSGINLKMDFFKRQEYCSANRLPFDPNLYANPILPQSQEPRQGRLLPRFINRLITWTRTPLVPLEKDFDVHIGTREVQP